VLSLELGYWRASWRTEGRVSRVVKDEMGEGAYQWRSQCLCWRRLRLPLLHTTFCRIDHFCLQGLWLSGELD